MIRYWYVYAKFPLRPTSLTIMTACLERPERDIYSSIAMLWWFIQIHLNSSLCSLKVQYIFLKVRKMLDIQQIFTL